MPKNIIDVYSGNGLVYVRFDKPVQAITLAPHQAVDLATRLAQFADIADQVGDQKPLILSDLKNTKVRARSARWPVYIIGPELTDPFNILCEWSTGNLSGFASIKTIEILLQNNDIEILERTDQK